MKGYIRFVSFIEISIEKQKRNCRLLIILVHGKIVLQGRFCPTDD